jgi:AraC family transcriptional regulator
MLVQLAHHTVGIASDRIFILISVQRDGAASIDPTQGPAATSRRRTPLQKWRMKRVIGLTRMHFAAQFRAATGRRPHDFVLQRRIDRARELLGDPELALVDVALSVGFQTQAHFTTVFKRFAGETPHRWRRLAPGHHAAEYAVAPQPGMEQGGAEMHQDG